MRRACEPGTHQPCQGVPRIPMLLTTLPPGTCNDPCSYDMPTRAKSLHEDPSASVTRNPTSLVYTAYPIATTRHNVTVFGTNVSAHFRDETVIPARSSAKFAHTAADRGYPTSNYSVWYIWYSKSTKITGGPANHLPPTRWAVGDSRKTFTQSSKRENVKTLRRR